MNLVAESCAVRCMGDAGHKAGAYYMHVSSPYRLKYIKPCYSATEIPSQWKLVTSKMCLGCFYMDTHYVVQCRAQEPLGDLYR